MGRCFQPDLRRLWLLELPGLDLLSTAPNLPSPLNPNPALLPAFLDRGQFRCSPPTAPHLTLRPASLISKFTGAGRLPTETLLAEGGAGAPASRECSHRDGQTPSSRGFPLMADTPKDPPAGIPTLCKSPPVWSCRNLCPLPEVALPHTGCTKPVELVVLRKQPVVKCQLPLQVVGADGLLGWTEAGGNGYARLSVCSGPAGTSGWSAGWATLPDCGCLVLRTERRGWPMRLVLLKRALLEERILHRRLAS